jgi:hypothetical protein
MMNQDSRTVYLELRTSGRCDHWGRHMGVERKQDLNLVIEQIAQLCERISGQEVSHTAVGVVHRASGDALNRDATALDGRG